MCAAQALSIPLSQRTVRQRPQPRARLPSCCSLSSESSIQNTDLWLDQVFSLSSIIRLLKPHITYEDDFRLGRLHNAAAQHDFRLCGQNSPRDRSRDPYHPTSICGHQALSHSSMGFPENAHINSTSQPIRCQERCGCWSFFCWLLCIPHLGDVIAKRRPIPRGCNRTQ